ncbi:MAG: DUF2497 domain-containing protein [Marinicaulis sp.]|nr:DUF2497 domain-containing protein [Marinicaulis sp.]NNL87465.1 DUF2497 domain-containing protein [Marinicaulis sp.]
MEEILASIRRIISEDEEDAPASDSDPSKAVAPEPSKPALVENTAPAETPAPRDQDVANPHLETEDVEMIKKNVAEAIAEDVEDAMLDKDTESAASDAFQSLSASVRVSEGPGQTLEDLVMQMLKPMLKEWLDANLPGIVEDKVEEEVQRVARRRR